MLRLLRRLHRWFGLAIALPVAVQGLTGALLALQPALPGAGGSDAPPQPASRIVAAAITMAGADARVIRFAAIEGPGEPVTVQLLHQDGSPEIIRLDPVTLEPVAEGWLDRMWPTLRSLHVAFLAQPYGGRSIGGWFGIGLVALLITGVPIWWPRGGGWKTALTVDTRLRGYRFQRSLHGAVGAWSVVVLFVVAATGVVLAFPATSRGLMGLQGGGPPRQPPVRWAQLDPAPPDIDKLLAAAVQAVPGARVGQVMLGGRGQPVRIFLAHAGTDGAVGRVALQLDPTTLRALSIQDPRAAAPADQAYRWMHDLHEGAGLGPVWRLLVGLSGAALVLFAVTGPLMWWMARRRRARVRRAASQSAPAT
ncbi:PepSY-associated TM helix domain-containing protein [Rhodopila sp.]|jgi:uncharacterized iron-regulated membrane protein|uniref:PepSY-associated TM helix domain-containing protein n=1 Tax=Rhodopila sp. TaxID=2480087 RepID=UPI002BFD3ED0|nr:PepSY-associated TM helix domain-containing protein [Rhodopila sp.]HVZ07617.1 PepSY-associated TM helix domain-containing protein [Rhodopila sp.]